jgi:hypothetical protein
MTAQASTAGEPTVPDPAEDPVVKDTPDAAPDTAPDQKAPQDSRQQETPDLDKEVQTAEKRIADREAYLQELKEKLSDQDREVTKYRESLKRQESAPVPEPEPQREQALPDPQKQAALDLGISGEQFLNLLRDNPDQALSAIVEAAEKKAEKRILGQIPEQLERHRLGMETQQKVMRIREELGDDQFGLFRNAVSQYQQSGFAPTPEHIMNDIRFGPPEHQRKLMEYGMAALQQAKEQESPAAQKPPESTNPATRQWPMAPGGASPLQPQTRRNDATGRRGSMLPDSWNV